MQTADKVYLCQLIAFNCIDHITVQHMYAQTIMQIFIDLHTMAEYIIKSIKKKTGHIKLRGEAELLGGEASSPLSPLDETLLYTHEAIGSQQIMLTKDQLLPTFPHLDCVSPAPQSMHLKKTGTT